MPKVIVRAFACSLDGFGAGLQQSQSEPFGKNAFQIMNWFLPTHTFKSMFGSEKGSTIDLKDPQTIVRFTWLRSFHHPVAIR